MRRRYRVPPITSEQQFQINTARIELEADELGRIVADVHGGYAAVELYEEDEEDLLLFGDPARIYLPRRRLKVELDALFEQMTIHRPPAPTTPART